MSSHDWRAATRRMRQVMAGETPDRVPFLFDLQEDVTCRVVGATVRELLTDAERLAEAAIQTAEFFGQDSVGVMGAYAGPYEALAFAKVNDKENLFHWYDYATPFIDTGKLCATADDIRNLRIPAHGEIEPWPTLFRAARLVEEETGVERSTFDPSLTWSNIQMFRGAQAYLDVRREPGLLLELCEKIYESQMDLYRSQCELMGHKPTSIVNAQYAFNKTMLGFEDAWKFEGQFVVRMCKETGLPLLIHNCGFEPYWEELVTRLIEEGVVVLAVNGSHPLDLDEWVRFRATFPEIAIYGASIFINAELENGTPEDVEERVRQNIVALGPSGRFVVTPTCSAHWRNPMRNLLAVRSAVEKYGYYPINVDA